MPRKARAAVAWCEAASSTALKWTYLYVPEVIFERLTGATIEELARTCAPALQDLLQEDDLSDLPLFANLEALDEQTSGMEDFADAKTLDQLPSRYRKAIEQAVMLFKFFENKPGMNYAPVFNALLGSMDEVAKGLLLRELQPELPATSEEQKAWFSPYTGKLDARSVTRYSQMAQNLKKTLVFNNGLFPLGLLRMCMDYALNDKTHIGGVFEVIRVRFQIAGGRKRLELVKRIYEFRNTFIAHQEKELQDKKLAERELRVWIDGLSKLYEAGQ